MAGETSVDATSRRASGPTENDMHEEDDRESERHSSATYAGKIPNNLKLQTFDSDRAKYRSREMQRHI